MTRHWHKPPRCTQPALHPGQCQGTLPSWTQGDRAVPAYGQSCLNKAHGSVGLSVPQFGVPASGDVSWNETSICSPSWPFCFLKTEKRGKVRQVLHVCVLWESVFEPAVPRPGTSALGIHGRT